MRIELSNLRNENFAAAAADIYKCFDQIQRPLLYEIMEKAGMAKEILSAYKSSQEELKVRKTISGGLGSEYKRETSIPQGDPFSMMLIALLMRPWMKQMEEMEVISRILADDLFIFNAGKNILKT